MAKQAERAPRGSVEIKAGSVQFRVDEDQRQALEEAARAEGDSLGNWCRRHLLKIAGWKYPGASGQASGAESN